MNYRIDRSSIYDQTASPRGANNPFGKQPVLSLGADSNVVEIQNTAGHQQAEAPGGTQGLQLDIGTEIDVSQAVAYFRGLACEVLQRGHTLFLIFGDDTDTAKVQAAVRELAENGEAVIVDNVHERHKTNGDEEDLLAA